MKEYIKKIIASLLLTAIIPMASGFCFMALFASPLIQIKTAEAKTIETAVIGSFETCDRSQIDESPADQPVPAPMPSHNNSLLPCCIDGSHSGILAISQQLLDSGKSFAVAVTVNNDSLTDIYFETDPYQIPITAPPNLLAVRTTILRL